jgi:brefeldin A-resistance guanine nucleotide exchange factor 1
MRTQGVYPSYTADGQLTQQRNIQHVCLDLLLAFVNDMAARAEGVRALF